MGKNLFDRIGVVLLIVTLVVGIAAFVVRGEGEAPPGGEELYVYPCKFGPVIFNHSAHADRADDCMVCHHMGEDSGGCRECHEDDPDTSEEYPLMTIFHKKLADFEDMEEYQSCMSCHNDPKNQKKILQACETCTPGKPGCPENGVKCAQTCQGCHM